MRTLPLLALIFTSCTVANTKNPAGGTATYAALGSDSTGINITPDGINIATNKNAAGFAKATTAATAVTGILSLAPQQ